MSIIWLNSRRFTPPAGEEFWTPAEWGTSIVWYDPRDSSRTSNLITGVQDKSGGGRHLTATVGQRPAYIADWLNGQPAMNYGAALNNNRLSWTGTAFDPVRTFGVAHYEGPDPIVGFTGLLSYPFATNASLLLAEAPNQWFGLRPVFLNGVETSSNIAMPTIAAPFLWADDIAPSAGRNTIWVGADRFEFNRGWRGKIGQVIITLFLPTLRERRIVTGYLAWEYGLEWLLPADHPFRNRRPLLSD